MGHREYLRPQLTKSFMRVVRIVSPKNLPRSILSPINGLFSPHIHQANCQNEKKYPHFDSHKEAQTTFNEISVQNSTRKKKNSFIKSGLGLFMAIEMGIFLF